MGEIVCAHPKGAAGLRSLFEFGKARGREGSVGCRPLWVGFADYRRAVQVGQFIPCLFAAADQRAGSPEKRKGVPRISGFWIVSEAFYGSSLAK